MLRILPAYWTFLLGVAVFQGMGLTDVSARGWITAATYTSSIVPNGHWDLGHSWSLSVEEHFYLIWPLLLVVLGARRAFLVSAAYVLATPVLRVALGYFYFRQNPDPWIIGISMLTPTRFDSIAIGCCLALLATSERFAPCLRLSPRTSRCLFVIAVGLFVSLAAVSLSFSQFKAVNYYNLILGPSVMSVIMAVLIWSAANSQGGLSNFILNSRPLQAIGILSYSLYLWQQLFLNPDRTGWAFTWPVNVVLAFLVAGLSYVCIESPFLRLKNRLGHSFRQLQSHA